MKCEACDFFDCGYMCKCRFHNDNIFTLDVDSKPPSNKGETGSMEGLSSLFG